MVISDGGGGYETDFCTLQELFVAAGSGSDDQGIGLKQVIAGDAAAGKIDYIGVRLKYTLKKRDM